MNSTSGLFKALASFFVSLILSSTFVVAQQANFELAERFTTQKMTKLIGTTSVNPRWIDDTDNFWYEYKNEEGNNWYYVDASKRTKRLLFDQEEIASKLSEEFKRPFNAKDLDLKDFEYNTDKELFTFHIDSVEFTYNLNGNRLIKGDSIEAEKRLPWTSFSPDSTWIAFAKNHNLYIMKSDDPDSVEHQLTTDGERWFSYQANIGDTTSDKRLRARVRWFDNEKKLWVPRTDMRKVSELWVINMLKKRPELETYKYAMPGEEEVGIQYIEFFDIEDKSRTVLDAEKWEDQSLIGGFGNVQTGDFGSTSSDYLYVYRMDRTSSKVDILKANTSTGEVEVILSEESKPYLNWRFRYLGVIENGKEFLWWSEQSGWGQLYRYDSEGNLKNRITKGNFVAANVVKVDTTAQTIFFTGYGKEKGQNPYFQNLYSIKFDGSGFKHLSPEDANHQIRSSQEGNYFVDNYSKVDQPTKSVLRDASGKVILDLEAVDISRATEMGWKFPEEITVKAADGVTDLYGVMWKPFDFDSTKNYPVIAYVYPGPQTEPFPTTFGRSRHQTLAQVGFIVVALGNRGGSPVRSRYYHTYGYGDLRDYPLADNKYAIEQLAGRHSFIDDSRVGIYGHSGGGFMSTAALLTYPDFYDVAVSSAGNHDNNVYNRWWSEVHNGVKEITKTVKEMNADSVEVEKTVTTFDAPIETNMALVENLQGHLLLVHGNIDNNVHPANTIRLVDALVKAGKRFDMMILPGRRHGFGASQPYFNRMTWYYFAEHLLGDYRTNIEFNIPKDED